MKIKRYFLKIMASLVASASLMCATAVPGRAEEGEVFSKIFSMSLSDSQKWFIGVNKQIPLIWTKSTEFSNHFKRVLKECKYEMKNAISKEADEDWPGELDIKIGNYTLSKDSYKHIVYGSYSWGVHATGLHSEKGLPFLKKSLENFRNKANKLIKNNATNCSCKELTNLEKWIEQENNTAKQKNNNAYTKLPGLNKYNFNFSDANHANERYLFPKKWAFKDLISALESAISQKEGKKDYHFKTQHTIKDPKNSNQEIEVTLVVDDKNHIKTFFPTNIKGPASAPKPKKAKNSASSLKKAKNSASSLKKAKNSASSLEETKDSDSSSEKAKNSDSSSEKAKNSDSSSEKAKNSDSSSEKAKNSAFGSLNIQNTIYFPVNVQNFVYWPTYFQAPVYYPTHLQNAAYYPVWPKY